MAAGAARARDPLVEDLAPAEGIVLGWLAAASALGALGYAQQALGVAAPDTGWAFAAVSAGAALALGWARRGGDAARLLLPLGLVATLVALQPIGRFAGQDAVLLAGPAAAVLLAAARSRRWLLALLAVAIAQPANVQAYTAPLGLYLLAVGVICRRSPPPTDAELRWHEWAALAGCACLTLPQAAQSFEPGGAFWGLVLLAEGLIPFPREGGGHLAARST